MLEEYICTMHIKSRVVRKRGRELNKKSLYGSAICLGTKPPVFFTRKERIMELRQ